MDENEPSPPADKKVHKTKSRERKDKKKDREKKDKVKENAGERLFFCVAVTGG